MTLAVPKPVSLTPPAPSGITTELVYVTDDMAGKWLATNFGNRPVRKAMVARIAGCIERGEFVFTAETVKFDRDGNLIDGQHRLNAIVESGLGAWLLVVRGLSREAAEFMDQGATRTIADVLGQRGVSNRHAVSAIARWRLLWDLGSYSRHGKGSRDITRAEVVEYSHQNEDTLTLAAHQAASVARALGCGGSAVFGLMFNVFEEVSRKHALEFFAQLADGVGLTGGDPILTLRNRLIREGTKAYLPGELMYGICKAWNTWREGKTLRNVYFSNPSPGTLFAR